MIKLAFNKAKPNLVFSIDEVVRESIVGGIVEYYKGTLMDTSTVPDTRTEGYKVQVMAFESDWVDVPTDVGGTSEVNNQDKTVDPTTSKQTIKPDAGYTGLNKVTVNAAAIDTVSPVTPTTSAQTINPGTGKLGIASVTVNAVTSAIDANITAGNIKKDVVILGVTGTYEATSEDYALFYDRSNYEGNSWSDAVEANDASYVKAFIDAFRVVSENAIPVKIIYSGDTNTEVGTGLFDSSAYSIEFHPAGGGTFNIEIEQDPDTQEDVVVVHEVVTDDDDDEELGVM